MNAPLYKFEIDDKTSYIKRTEISDYTTQPLTNGDLLYIFYIPNKAGGRVKRSITSSSMSNLQNGRIYTFDSDENKVKELMRSHLVNRLKNARAIRVRAINMLKKLGYHEDIVKYDEI